MLSASWPAHAADEELLFAEIPTVSLVSRREEPVMQAPAAVTVLTQEDIRRSGLTTIPELLRMVPGLDVAQIIGNAWAISIRGFNAQYANKLLVMIDGRTVYTPAFGGVFWDMHDLMLEDVERIEVIRGPGGSLWGANAVNGIINIVTKSAKDTQGGVVMAGGGSEERAFGGMRWGGKINEEAFYRIYFKGFDRDEQITTTGQPAGDGWAGYRGGFRVDWDATKTDRVTFHGDLFRVNANQPESHWSLTPPFQAYQVDSLIDTGGHIVGLWRHALADGSEFQLQSFFDYYEHRTESLTETANLFDLDFQHRFPLGTRQQIIWGLGYRSNWFEFDNSDSVAFVPDRRHDDLYSAFIHDDVTLIEDKLHLSVGSKLEYNNFTGFEVQPSGQLAWTPTPQQTVWATVARSVRTPAASDDSLQVRIFTTPGPAEGRIFGNTDLAAEEALSLELGYRVQPTKRLQLDAVAFYSFYDNLVTLRTETPFFQPTPLPAHVVIPLVFNNDLEGETYGFEVASTYAVTDRWKLSASYSLLKMQLHSKLPGSAGESAEGESPQQQFQVHSLLDLPRHISLDLAAYYVDRLPAQGIPAYLRLDVRCAWQPTKNLELTVGVQNALDPSHPESTGTGVFRPTEIQRNVYGKVTWRF